MEFQSLTRRELQSLCKMNKIPANMTNIAMADALKSLEFVEGIEEISKPKESESAQSSIESPAKSEVTSPYVPPTGGRSTRQRTTAKVEPQTLQPMTRTRGTARKTQAKNKEESRADATETPAVVAQNSRRRVPVASVCRKMESQLKECVEENEKKGVPITPVALEGTIRRRGLNMESEVRRVYGTRRSARLAEKNVEILSEAKNEKHEILRSDLFTKQEDENMEMNMNDNEVSDCGHEVSEITGVEVETSLEEDFKKMNDTEVSSGKKQDVSDEYDENKLESNEEEKQSQISETDYPNLEMDQCIDAGHKQLSIQGETGSELDGEKTDETEPSNGENVAMPLNESNDFEDDDDGSPPDVCSFESNKNGFEDATGLTTDKDADETDLKDIIISLENIEFADDVEQDEVGEENETNLYSPLEKMSSLDIENLPHGGNEIADEGKVPENVLDSINRFYVYSPIKHGGGLESDATVHSPMHQKADFLQEIKSSVIEAEPSIPISPRFTGMDSSFFTTQLKSLTPTKKSASKAPATMKKIADVLDNKENIGSCGSKLVLTKERVKIAKDTFEDVNKNKGLHDLSMRKLHKMLKEKLQITNKSSKDEDGNKATTRPALQVLPGNILGNETES